MQRILAAVFVLVLGLGLAPNATAGHRSDTCNTSALIVTDNMGAMCFLILACPAASLTCSWDLSVSAQGVGYVRGRVADFATGQTLITCGPELLECSTTALYSLPPTAVVSLDCFVFGGGPHHPALLARLTCTASVVDHSG
jgi:hypothetical protein